MRWITQFENGESRELRLVGFGSLNVVVMLAVKEVLIQHASNRSNVSFMVGGLRRHQVEGRHRQHNIFNGRDVCT